MATVQEITAALEALGSPPGARGRSGWQEARCPAHPDKIRSFGFKAREDGSVAVKCHAGCSREAILGALGLSTATGGPGASRGPKPRLGATGGLSEATAEILEPEEEETSPPPEAPGTPPPVLPIPAGLPPPGGLLLYKGSKPARVWWYRNEAGERLLAVVRWDIPGERKRIRHVTVGRAGSGYSWRLGGIPREGRPLYGLDRLARSPDAPVIVAEGEKAADAAEERFPGVVGISPLGGASAIALQDWSPLAQRRVFCWPDGDMPGVKAMEEVCRILPTARLVEPLPWVPPHWDLADEVPAHLEDGGLEDLLARAWTPGMVPTRQRAEWVKDCTLFRPWNQAYVGPWKGIMFKKGQAALEEVAS